MATTCFELQTFYMKDLYVLDIQNFITSNKKIQTEIYSKFLTYSAMM